ncbi:hypothetical protein CRE_14522 [Caenorhabditis remanei]|uniref:Uncharacterized protein n=1 Tax=Caenorhabditis remanei TaxID=31234 RepID=E3M9C8_CAERE|nr:hypothetical protein CRE_14522 [Caenorhabditis remanei]
MYIEENITLEEDLELLMKGKNEPKEKADNPKKDRNQSNKSDRSEKQKKTRLCLFCKDSEHHSSKCTKFVSIKDRKDFLNREGRCLNCHSNAHKTAECYSTRPCYFCKGRHSSVLCTNRGESSSPSSAISSRDSKHNQQAKTKVKTATTNVTHTEEVEEAVQCETQTTERAPTTTSKAFVPTIQAKARNKVSGEWTTISTHYTTENLWIAYSEGTREVQRSLHCRLHRKRVS